MDTGSSITSIIDDKLLGNIHEVNNPINMRTNVGCRVINKMGQISGLHKDMWCVPEGVVNIFGFADLAEQYRITYDSSKGDKFNVHTDTGIVKFQRNEKLYEYVLLEGYEEEVNKMEKVMNETPMNVEIVAENRRNYLTQQFERAKVS